MHRGHGSSAVPPQKVFERVITILIGLITHPASGRVFSAYALTDNTLIITIRRVSYLIGNNYKLGSDIALYHSIWYKKYENGLIEYWGRSNSPSTGTGGQGFVTINFPVPFKDMNYIVTASAEYADSSTATFETSVQRNSANRAYIYAKTNTGPVTGAWVQWEAKGYWK